MPLNNMRKRKVVVIGAGLVGLATAYRIIEKYKNISLTLLEKEPGPARHQSGHNSGVIHSGIYYKPGSLKAQNCIRGYHDLLDFCDRFQVPYQLTGKLIVATNAVEAEQLPVLQGRAAANGLAGVELLTAEAVAEKEPYVKAHSALWVPQTGIVDFPAMAEELSCQLQQNGATILYGYAVDEISYTPKCVLIHANGQSFEADQAVNCAGLYSDKIARMAGVSLEHRIIPFRGEYFMLSEKAAQKIKGLIYPVPHPGLPFLGVHLTRMINGQVEAGPNAVLALKREGYERGAFSLKDTLDTLTYGGFWKMAAGFKSIGFGEWKKTMSRTAFTRAVQQLVPDITSEDLTPATSGVRAQAIRKDGSLIDDFLILHSGNMIHVCNAPSPAATSCLSIGKTIADMVRLEV